jgi:hypothetical protein
MHRPQYILIIVLIIIVAIGAVFLFVHKEPRHRLKTK